MADVEKDSKKISSKPHNIGDSDNPCTGCGACAIVCPSDAISIRLDNEGFLCAYVNEERCIKCGRCIGVCLKFGTAKETPELTGGQLFSAKSSSQSTVKSCTSGGIAHELTAHAISCGMPVAGVVYDFATDTAKTVIAKIGSEAEKFKGSKYLQSHTLPSFQSLVEMAKKDKDKQYLVFGTPCQIYGLSKALELNKIRDRFVLVDLFCHGVPSNMVWQSFLAASKRKLKIQDIDKVAFRDKSFGWHNFVITITSGEQMLKQPSERSHFYYAFFDNILLGAACFDCPVRQKFSAADLRLGDFWGKKFQNTEEGISAVLIFTKKGEDFFEAPEGIEILGKEDIDSCLGAQSVKIYKGLEIRKQALESLRSTGDLEKTVKNYRKSFSLARRRKLAFKKGVAYLPDPLRVLVRNLYKNIK